MFLHQETEWRFSAKSIVFESKNFPNDIFQTAVHDFRQESGFLSLLMMVEKGQSLLRDAKYYDLSVIITRTRPIL